MEPYRESKTFLVRIELSATFDDDYEGDDDGGVWIRRWLDETQPQVVASVMRALASDPRVRVRARPRGKSPDDEVEISVELQTRR